MAIAGASQYKTAAILANKNGTVGATTGNGIIGSLGAVDILDIGRSLTGDNGIGLSGNARALNKQFLESSSSTFNTIFSLGVAGTSSIEGLQTQISALRSSMSESQLSREVRGQLYDSDA